jgi:TonB-linked SusC/RagA family outer membrane protein
MRQFKRLLLLGISIFYSGIVMAQENIITGTITTVDNTPLFGANVLVKGTKNFALTNSFGKFSIKANKGQVLIITFVGYVNREVTVGNDNSIIIKMSFADATLSEVVVTALGVRKEKKSLGYSVQDIKGEELIETGRTNFVSALQGRVAGLEIGSTGGLPGASNTIVIRGGSSIDRNNQPLFVIDGVPIDNSTIAEGNLLNDAPSRNTDYSSRIGDIDPNDIESITVLKGPAATALYGLEAANGAIVITTKRSKKGKLSVSYNGNIRFDRSTRFPEIQKIYGQGTGGLTNNYTLNRWGAKLPEGTQVFDNVKNFFETGITHTHNISLSGGKEILNGGLSLNLTDQKGTVPNTNYKRYSARVSFNSKLGNKITLSGSGSFINTTNNKAAKGAGSFYLYALLWPGTDDMRNYLNSSGDKEILLDQNPASPTTDPDFFDNPFYTVNKNKAQDKTNRYQLSTTINYTPLSWLSFTGRFGYDKYETDGFTYLNPKSNQGFPFGVALIVPKSVGGIYSDYNDNFRYFNYLAMVNIKKSFYKWNTQLSIGNSLDDRSDKITSRYAEKQRPGPDNIYNINNYEKFNPALPQYAGINGYKRRLISVFGEFKIDYNNYLYLSVTGRNDYTSTLPIDNNSFFYPSVSLAYILTESEKSIAATTAMNYAKFRISYAEVGKDGSPHRIFPALDPFTRTGGGIQVSVFGSNPNLKPERTKAFEIGGEFKFYKSRLGLDFTFYTMKSDKQISTPRLSYISGYILQLVNGGTIRNSGIEILLTGTPIKTKNFSWDITNNFTLNRNKVLALPGNFAEYYISDTWLHGNVRAGYDKGQTFYTLRGNYFGRNSKNELLIGTTGYPVAFTSVNDFAVIGNREQNYNWGITNRIRYKNFGLSMLWHFRSGGDIYNATNLVLTQFGISKLTENRGTKVVLDGIVQSTGLVNQKEITLDESWYNNTSRGAISELFIEKNIYAIRMRDISITYGLPIKSKRSFIKSLDFNITANNLILITDYSGGDPDVNGLNGSNRGSGAVGFDYFSVPNPITFQFGIAAKF